MFAKYIRQKTKSIIYKNQGYFFLIEKIRSPVSSQNGVRRIRISSHLKQL